MVKNGAPPRAVGVEWLCRDYRVFAPLETGSENVIDDVEDINRVFPQSQSLMDDVEKKTEQ